MGVACSRDRTRARVLVLCYWRQDGRVGAVPCLHSLACAGVHADAHSDARADAARDADLAGTARDVEAVFELLRVPGQPPLLVEGSRAQRHEPSAGGGLALFGSFCLGIGQPMPAAARRVLAAGSPRSLSQARVRSRLSVARSLTQRACGARACRCVTCARSSNRYCSNRSALGTTEDRFAASQRLSRMRCVRALLLSLPPTRLEPNPCRHRILSSVVEEGACRRSRRSVSARRRSRRCARRGQS
eukprot:3067475-Pleurochrysis_carterae.AAC.2